MWCLFIGHFLCPPSTPFLNCFCYKTLFPCLSSDEKTNEPALSKSAHPDLNPNLIPSLISYANHLQTTNHHSHHSQQANSTEGLDHQKFKDLVTYLYHCMASKQQQQQQQQSSSASSDPTKVSDPSIQLSCQTLQLDRKITLLCPDPPCGGCR